MTALSVLVVGRGGPISSMLHDDLQSKGFKSEKVTIVVSKEASNQFDGGRFVVNDLVQMESMMSSYTHLVYIMNDGLGSFIPHAEDERWALNIATILALYPEKTGVFVGSAFGLLENKKKNSINADVFSVDLSNIPKLLRPFYLAELAWWRGIYEGMNGYIVLPTWIQYQKESSAWTERLNQYRACVELREVVDYCSALITQNGSFPTRKLLTSSANSSALDCLSPSDISPTPISWIDGIKFNFSNQHPILKEFFRQPRYFEDI